MASGHWEYQTYWGVDPDTGRPKRVTRRVWVADKVDSGAQRAAARRAAEARRRAEAAARRRAREIARRAAVERAAKERTKALAARNVGRVRNEVERMRAENRTAAYEKLREIKAEQARRALQARTPSGKETNVVRPTVAPASAVPSKTPPGRTTGDRYRRSLVNKAATQAQQLAEQRRQQAVRERWEGMAYHYRKQQALTNPETKPTEWESIIATEKAKGPGKADIETIRKLSEKYNAYAEKVAAENKRLVDEFNAAVDAGKDKRAETLYRAWEANYKEYKRLFGDGSNPEKEGSFSKFWRDYQKVEQDNAAWWKSQMQATFDANRAEVNRRVAELEKTRRRTSAQIDELAQLRELQRVYSGQTGQVPVYHDDGRVTWRRRTVQEELEVRDAERRVTMEKLRAEYVAKLRAREDLMRREGLVEGRGGRLIDREDLQVERLQDLVVKEDFGGKPPELRRPEDIQNFVDHIVRRWNGPPEPAKWKYDMGGGRTLTPEWVGWEKQRSDFERRAYAYFGSGTPQVWDRALAIPGVSHAMAALQGGTSAIGTGGRTIAKVVSGSSTIEVTIPLDKLPPGIRAKAQNDPVFHGVQGVGGIPLTTGLIGGGLVQGKGYINDTLSQWMATPEGKAWYQKYLSGERATSQQEDWEFMKVWFDPKASPADKLDALNQYGSQPFGDDAQNLLFQLLVDPTNAIPLKATTYLARAKYAAELGDKSKWLGSSKLGTIRDFVKVDESQLKLRGELQKVLGKKADGVSAKKLTDELMAEVAGIKNRDEMAEAVRRKLTALGINPREINDAQLLSLVEDALTSRLRHEGVDYTTQVQDIRKKREAMLARKAQRKAARRQRAMVRVQKKKAGQQARAQAAVAAEQRLRAVRREHVEKLNEKIAAEGGAAPAGVAAREATGRPPAPAEPVAAPKVTPVKAVEPPNAPRAEGGKTRTHKGLEDARTQSMHQVLDRRRRSTAALAKLRESALKQPRRRASVFADRFRIRHASEYYETDALGNLIPKDPSFLKSRRGYAEVVNKALAGDVVAKERVAKLARWARNEARLHYEDMSRKSPFTQTDFDLAERAGVAGDADAEARLLNDRETVRHLKRTAGEMRKAGGAKKEGLRSYLNDFVFRRGGIVERDFGANSNAGMVADMRVGSKVQHKTFGVGEIEGVAGDVVTVRFGGTVRRLDARSPLLSFGRLASGADTSADVLYLGDDIVAAADSPRGVNDAYEVFSGLDNRLQYYKGGLFDKVRSVTWRRTLGPARFGRMLEELDMMDELADYAGVAAFRDGGQVLFELFHRLRLAKDFKKLKRLSQYVDEYIAQFDDPADSLFAWQWKVMEERAGLPWALDYADGWAESNFLLAAERWNMHPNLALSMIPNGFYAHRAPNRFRLSSALLGIEKSPIFRAAPADWIETDALEAITEVFDPAARVARRKLTTWTPEQAAARAQEIARHPTKIVHYAAERYGSFYKAFKLRNRLTDELIHAVSVEPGALDSASLAEVLADYPHLLPETLTDGGREMLVKRLEAVLSSEVAASMPLSEWNARVRARADEAVARGAYGEAEGILRSLRDKEKEHFKPRAEYKELREAALTAYWEGKLPLRNAAAHKLMYLAHLQDNPKSWVESTFVFVDYMRALGKVDEARGFVHELFRERIKNLGPRAVAERLHLGDGALPREWVLWDELGFTPNLGRVKAWSDNVQRGERVLLDGSDARKLREIGQYDEASDIERDMFGRTDERFKEGSAYVGTTDLDWVSDVVLRRIEDYKALMAKGEDVKARAELYKASRALGEVVGRTLLNGVASFDGETLRELAEAMAGTYEGKFIINHMRDTVGDEGVAAWLNLADNLGYSPRLDLSVRDRVDAKGRTEGAYGRAAARSEEIKAEPLHPRYGPWVEELGPEPSPAAGPAAEIADPPITPADTQAMSATAALLKAITGMTEEEYWAYLKQRAFETLNSKTASAEQKARARQVQLDLKRAEYIKRRAKAAGAYVDGDERARFSSRVNAEVGKDAEDLIAPKEVSAFVRDRDSVLVEQARTYWRLWRSRSSDVAAARVNGVTFKGQKMDHVPMAVYRRADELISDSLAEMRGRRANYFTRSRKGPAKESDKPFGKLSDEDPRVVVRKVKALQKLKVETGWDISVDAYDQVRKVLWRGHVQRIKGMDLMTRAQAIARRTGADFDEVFLKLRAKDARYEARVQLRMLAWGEMYGHSADEILAEFTARYTDDGTLRHWEPKLTRLQARTLEEQIKELSGVKDLTDHDSMREFLMSRNAPPLIGRGASRDAAREFLVRIGAWSPRRAEEIAAGKASWSVEDEAAYWFNSYGVIPEWADVQRLGTDFADMFHDQATYYEMMRRWGIFNRQAEIALRLSGKSAAEIEEALLKGDPALGLKGKRSLDLQRRYVIERYGTLVSPDGKTLTAMPWLMTPRELRSYIAKRHIDGLPLAHDLIQSTDELAQVQKIIEDSMDEFWAKYIGTKAASGPITYDDVFRFASEIQARLLADPKWSNRYRDVFGNLLRGWGWFNRALIFSQMSFMAVNMIDVPIKTAWFRYTRRALFDTSRASAEGLRRADDLTPQMLGVDTETTLYRFRQRSPLEQIRHPVRKGALEDWERFGGVVRAATEWAPMVAGKAEMAGKMRLARGMYANVFDEAMRRLGDADLADAAARKFVKAEMNKMWPTLANAGPIEKLFNTLVPFASYSVKNKLLFIGEALNHPSIINQITYVSRAVEQYNRERWEEKHPGEAMPDAYATRIELPWAPGYYLDLGQFSDATRGLKPLFTAGEKRSVIQRVSEWVRFVNPGPQAGIYMLTNALGVTQRVQWKPVFDSAGYITGYEKVITGWTEPWSGDQPTPSSFLWFVEAWESWQEAGAGGLTLGEISQLVGKVALFDAISTPSRGYGLFELYKVMKERNPVVAERWLTTTGQGKLLQDWLLAMRTDNEDFADWYSLTMRWQVDERRWFHSQTPEFQRTVGEAYDRMDAIRESYENRLLYLTPGTAEYREVKAEMLLAISEVYRLTPELMIKEVYSMSASEWSQQLAKWQTSMKMDEFFALMDQRPLRANYDSVAAYNDAMDAWRHQKEVFLKTYPDVEAALGNARAEYEAQRDRVEKEWDEVLGRIAKRNEMIEAFKKADKDDEADLLYLQNELDYSILERDYVALYWGPDDYQTLPKGMYGPPGIRDRALKNVTELLDFDRVRWEKAKREGTTEKFLSDAKYAQGMKEVILRAKGGDPFGKFDPAKFVKALKRNPDLLEMYFDRNPGKREQWKKTDDYIRFISAWGKAARAGDWDRAERLWNALPQWVKDRYYAKHPERRQKAIQSAAYSGWMKRWVAHFDRGDTKGGMRFFWSMPKWVRERYFAKHPDKRVKWEAQLKFGAQLAEYFATDKSAQAAYLNAHPELKKWLAQHVSSKEQRRQAIMAAYAAIPKEDQWLRRIFRERYPEVFSQEAAGKRKLNRVYDKLSSHPEMLPEFEQWVKAIWASYTEMLKHPVRPVSWDVQTQRDVPARRRRRSMSASESSQ